MGFRNNYEELRKRNWNEKVTGWIFKIKWKTVGIWLFLELRGKNVIFGKVGNYEVICIIRSLKLRIKSI